MDINQIPIDIKTENTKDGSITLKVNGKYLHSRYNPKIEAEKIVKHHYKKGRLYVLFGLGLGYLVNGLINTIDLEFDDLIVLEPSREIFKHANDLKYINKYFSENSISLLVEPSNDMIESLLGYLVDKHGGKVVLITSPNYNNIFKNTYERFLQQLRQIMFMNLLNVNTTLAWSKNWQENWILNLYNSKEATALTRITEKKLSCPVIIASGGPSLTKQLPLLKKMQNSALIICAGSTLNSLLKHQIKPHILVVIDGAKINFEHYRGVEEIHDIPLFYPLIAYNEIVEFHKGKKVIFNLHKDGLSELGEKIFEVDLGYASGGGSVATFCLSIAEQLTNGPICMIGQDLAFTNNQTHAEGNKLGKQISMEELLKSKQYFTIKGFYEDEVITNHSFNSMKHTLEIMIRGFKDRKVVNSTEGGVFIDGAEHISFEMFTNKYCSEENQAEIYSLLDRIKHECFDVKMVLNNIDEFLRTSMSNLEATVLLADNTLKLIEKFNCDEELIHVDHTLNDFEEELKKLLENTFLHYMFMSLVFRVTHQFEEERDNNDYLLLKTRYLYQSIKDLSLEANEYLKFIIAKID